MTRNSVVLLYDPDGIFPTGAQFSHEDLRQGLLQGSGTPHWSTGARFHVRAVKAAKERELVIFRGWAIDLQNREVLMRYGSGHWVWQSFAYWIDYCVENGA